MMALIPRKMDLLAVWPILIMMGIVMLARQFDVSFLPLLVQEIHGSINGASAWTGALSAVAGTAGALSGFLLGWLADRISPGKLAVVTACMAGAFMLSLHFVHGFLMLFIMRFLMIFCSSGLDPALQIWLSQRTPVESRGLIFGWGCSIRSCGNFTAPLAAGVVV